MKQDFYFLLCSVFPELLVDTVRDSHMTREVKTPLQASTEKVRDECVLLLIQAAEEGDNEAEDDDCRDN